MAKSSISIRELRVRTVCVPMQHPHRTASGVVSESPLVLTDIVTDGGTIGHSITFTYTRAALKSTAEFLANLEPFLVDQALAPREISRSLASRFRLLGTQGLVGMALAGADMALWDALARCHRLSLVQLLGGVEKPIPAYGAVGYDGVEGSAKTAEAWAKAGFKGIKAKIGYATVDEDLEVIRAMRSAVGDSVEIMVDYNQSLTPQQAINRLQVLDDEGLYWVEEPTLAHDYQGHARISSAINTPIQCGENWWGTLDMQHAIAANASDYMMPDVMKIGGVSGWLGAAELAQTNGIMLSSHLWPEVSAQLLSVTPTAHWLEYADWWNPIVAEPLVIDDGDVSIGDTPGSGVEWNEAAVEKFTV